MTRDEALTVLWATDGSTQSEAAIPLLRQIVLPSTDRLVVLAVAPHAFLSGARPDPSFVANASKAQRSLALVTTRQSAEKELKLLDPPSGVAFEVLARWGHPIEEILRASNSTACDLIVMAAKGHSNLRLMLLGSVVQGVVQYTTRPLLIARPGVSQVKRIVCGYDASPQARRALRYLSHLAIPKSTEIILANVVEHFTMPSSTPIAYRQSAIEEAQRINEKRHELAARHLKAAYESLSDQGRHVSTQLLSGVASKELDALAQREQADLLVVGSRKPSAARHYLLGSVAEKLSRHSRASLLVVR